MRSTGLLLVCMVAPVFGAVDGVVMNATTGKPQAGVAIVLVQPSNAGMKTLGSTKSGSDGSFRIDKDIPPGPGLLQGTHQGATYNLMLAPGGPTSGVRLTVFDATTKADTAGLAGHMLLIEPAADTLRISETFLFDNKSNLTYADTAKGSVQFFLPDAAADSVRVTINAPGGMPIQRAAEKTGAQGVYKITYPVKPGESRFDVNYTLPASGELAGKVLPAGVPLRLVTPASVKLSGPGIEMLEPDPQVKANIYQVTGANYKVAIEGNGSLREAGSGGAAAEGPGEDQGQPQLEVHAPKIYSRLVFVLVLAFAILGLGGAVLYRRGRA